MITEKVSHSVRQSPKLCGLLIGVVYTLINFATSTVQKWYFGNVSVLRIGFGLQVMSTLLLGMIQT